MEINRQSSGWAVSMSWSEAHESYAESSPAELAISSVADQYELAEECLRSVVIRAHRNGMTVIVESRS